MEQFSVPADDLVERLESKMFELSNGKVGPGSAVSSRHIEAVRQQLVKKRKQEEQFDPTVEEFLEMQREDKQVRANRAQEEFLHFQSAQRQTACAAGTYNPSSGAVACTPCLAGQFQAGVGQTACVPCAAGTFCGRSGLIAETACAAGTYNPSSGAVACTPCPAQRQREQQMRKMRNGRLRNEKKRFEENCLLRTYPSIKSAVWAEMPPPDTDEEFSQENVTIVVEVVSNCQTALSVHQCFSRFYASIDSFHFPHALHHVVMIMMC